MNVPIFKEEEEVVGANVDVTYYSLSICVERHHFPLPFSSSHVRKVCLIVQKGRGRGR